MAQKEEAILVFLQGLQRRHTGEVLLILALEVGVENAISSWIKPKGSKKKGRDTLR